VACLLALSLLFAAPSASAGPFDLDDDDDKKADKKDEGYGTYTPPAVTIKPRSYTLDECLALVDRNHPNLWAARARLASTHAQLDEAKWLPFWQWNASSNFGLLPPISGTIAYTSAPVSALGLNLGSSLQPVFSLDINGVLPLYTFGKIEAGKHAAEAQVRAFEWDLEKWRNFARMDVRRAYFGLQFSRDARYIVDDTIQRLDKAIGGIEKKIDKGDSTVDETDKMRLQLYRDEIVARSGDAQKGETYAIAALRFLTGIQTNFDIPDEPLKKPDRPLVAVVQYLSAARMFRPEIGQARAGVAARRALVDLQRAKYFPDFGLGFFGTYAVAPSVTTQNTALAPNPLNHFYVGGGIGFRWSLDILPNSARVQKAESDLEEAHALLRLALGGIAVEVENAHGTALEAKNREEAWDRAEHRSKRWISTVTDAIDLGAKDERALIEPLRAYVNARVNHMYALFDYNVAMSELARVSGWDTAAPTAK
jgi:outer membrane protein TolC